MKTHFETYIWPLKNKLYRMAYLWVKDRDVAQDILQSVFEKAWLRRQDLQQMGNPAGWLVRTLKNESLQHFRSGRRFEPLPVHEIEAEPEIPEDKPQHLNLVLAFMEKLPPKQKEVFHLREVEGLTYEEISGFLEISQDQVKVNLFRARKALKKHLTGIKWNIE
jgi:RNA polymerase sigma factor (sigma-70 family)